MQATTTLYETVNVYRTGNTMMMHRRALLPKKCVKTNGSENLQAKKITLRWHHPAIYLTILLGLLIYVIIAVVCTKKASVEVFVSQKVLRRRLMFIIATWVCVFLGFFGMGYGMFALESDSFPENVGLLFLCSVLMFIIAIIMYVVGARIIYASKIDDYYVWIKGVNLEYLNGLPRWEDRYISVPGGSIPPAVSGANRDCNQCGANVSVTDKFCWYCGVNLFE